MNIDELDDDEPGFEEYQDSSTVDPFYNSDPEPGITPRSDLYQQEEETKEEETWIYEDIFSGTNKAPNKSKGSYDNPKWDEFKL